MKKRKLKKLVVMMGVWMLLLAGSITALAGSRSCTFAGGSGELTVSRTGSWGKTRADNGSLVAYVNVATYTSDGRHLNTKNANAVSSVSTSYTGSGIGYAYSTHYVEGGFANRGSLTVYA